MRSRNAESGLVLIGFFDLRYDIVVDRNCFDRRGYGCLRLDSIETDREFEARDGNEKW